MRNKNNWNVKKEAVKKDKKWNQLLRVTKTEKKTSK